MKGESNWPPLPGKITLKKPSLIRVKNFAIFTGKNLGWSLFLIKLQVLWLYYKDTPAQVFSSEYCKIFEILKNTYLKNIYERLLLKVKKSPWKVPVKKFRRSCLVNSKACSFTKQVYQTWTALQVLLKL